MTRVFDAVVIGAGVVGCAIARLLTHHRLDGERVRVAILEAGPDVGVGTSKADTAILHTGFDATPGTLEARLVARGYQLLGDYRKNAGIAVERTGALVVAWDDEQASALPGLVKKAAANGYHALRAGRGGPPLRP
jgi:glycerol-3-phosphate dehydrogenase